jgi:cyclophilin family peptidyl-prolyl cis-trans isomerase
MVFIFVSLVIFGSNLKQIVWILSFFYTSSLFAANNSVVTIETPLGTFQMEMLADEAPNTVQNFLNYLERGDYTGTFFHRSVPGFVVQGGGFVYDATTNTAPAITADPPIANEFGVSNVRGTVAMAKTAAGPDSATNQWFVNLADNSANLDNQNGGFTVFARVIGDGMTVMDAIAALPLANLDNGGTFASTPLINFTGGALDASVFVTIISASVTNDPDFDGDGMPDSTDADDDNDGVPDVSDAFPLNDAEFADTDNDGTGNNADDDDDGDGVLDVNDAFPLDSAKSVVARLSNISTRGLVKIADEVMIGGVIITGDTAKTVVVRARGLSLQAADPNLTGLLSDPFVQLFRGADLIDSNDNWESHSRASEVPENLRPTRTEEAALVATLEPGAYTAIVRGLSEGQGVGIVEIFEVTNGDTSKLSNISTRGFVGTDDDVLIGGVIIAGDEDKTVTIRARGPSLIDADPNLQNLLADPLVQLFNSSGELIDSNDNWNDHSSAASLRADLQPSRSVESAITRTLAPGAYTAIVRGVANSTGIGIVEVFEID